MFRAFLPALSVLAVACDLTGEVATSEPCETVPTTPPTDTAPPTPTGDGLLPEEIDGIETWQTEQAFTFDVDAATSVTGNRISILVDAFPEQLDIVTTQTRAQDYNSSRSNNSGIIILEDEDGGDDVDNVDFLVQWGGEPECRALPCLSGGRDDGDVSRLVVDFDPADASQIRRKRIRLAQTTPSDVTFTGFLAVSCKKCTHRGHVTVLKASSSQDDSGIVLTSAAPWPWMGIYAAGADNPLYESNDAVKVNPLATGGTIDGSSWPTEIVVEDTPLGPTISFVW